MNDELRSMEQQQVWTVVPRVSRTVGSKWVFRNKRKEHGEISHYKARLVAQGFTQRPGIDFDEIYAPVVRYDSLRLLLALAVQNGWKPVQLDVKAAFLYGQLDEEIYMELPHGYEDQKGQSRDTHCAKLNKSIYGLRQSPREWYAYLTAFLQENNFHSCAFDPCVLLNDRVILAVYVDDITLYGPDDVVAEVTQLLKTRFQLSEAGK